MKKIIINLYMYRDLIGQIVSRDIKLKYRRSFLGYIWSILNPLLVMIVLTVVFSQLFKSNIENFPLYLLTGQVVFNFMSTSTTGAIFSIVDNGALLKKTYVPKYIFVIAKVTSCFVDYCFSLGALILVMIFTKSTFSYHLLITFFVAFELYIFCVGLGLLLASLNVFFRDIQYIYNAILTAWTYLTPLFYPIDILPDNLKWIITNLNPMYFYLQQFRDLVYYITFPCKEHILVGCCASIVMLALGSLVFYKTQNKFILYI